MKIQFFTEKKYGEALIGEYEFVPQNNLDLEEQIEIPLSEILDEMPTTFVTMQMLLTKMDAEYRTRVEKFSDMKSKYTKHDCYQFEYENQRITKFSRIVVVNNNREFSKDHFGTFYVPENGTLKLTIKPLRCSICQTDKSFVNPVKVKYGTQMDCLDCMERIDRNREIYKKKQESAEYYSSWNTTLSEKDESLGYVSDIPGNFAGWGM